MYYIRAQQTFPIHSFLDETQMVYM